MSEAKQKVNFEAYWSSVHHGDFSVRLPDHMGPHKNNPPENELDISAVCTCRHFELPATYNNNPGEAHPEYELIYVEKGVFLDASEETPIELHAGNAVLFKPMYFHKTVCDGTHSASIFIVSFKCDSKIMETFLGERDRVHFKISAEQRQVLAAAFAAGVKAYSTNSHFCELKDRPYLIYRQIFINYIEILLLQVINSEMVNIKDEKLFFEQLQSFSPITNEIIAYLKEKLYSEVTINELCQKLGYSRGHLCNHFKADTGKSIMNYYQSIKIEEAKRLILETGLDLGSISDTLGFSNPQYFNKVFRRLTGHTPGHFRKTIFKGSLEKEK